MALVQIAYTFADGDSLAATVQPDSSFPDAIDEARVQVRRLFGEAMGVLDVEVRDERGDERR